MTLKFIRIKKPTKAKTYRGKNRCTKNPRTERNELAEIWNIRIIEEMFDRYINDRE